MPWVRFDDQYPINRKISRLSDGAYRLHDSAIFWCSRNLTDGIVPTDDLADVHPRARALQRLVAELKRRDLWHEIGVACDSPECPANPDNGRSNAVSDAVRNGVTGWVVHDYLEYQPSKTQVKRDREATAERQRRWRERNKKEQVEGDRHAVSNDSSSTVTNSAPSRPVPSRRDGGSVDESSSGSRRAQEDDDGQKTKTDDHALELLIIGTLADLTGRNVDHDHAARIRKQLLDGRTVGNPLAYVAKALRERPTDFLPDEAPAARDEPWDRDPAPDQDVINAAGRAAVDEVIRDVKARAARTEGTET